MSNANEPAQRAEQIQVVILAAGLETRLGHSVPKTLTPLANGRSLMAHQIDGIRAVFGASARITVVVGFKKEMIMETFPGLLFAYNERFDTTGTARSLLRALQASAVGGVLWLNGDVVFDHRLLSDLRPLMRGGQSFVCVNTCPVGEEEIKYTRDADGMVRELSKTVVGTAEGEAVGINYVAAKDKALLIAQLTVCGEQDYFERGLEYAIEDGMRVHPVDTGEFYAIEVDCKVDLAQANQEIVGGTPRSGYGRRVVAPRTPADESMRNSHRDP